MSGAVVLSHACCGCGWRCALPGRCPACRRVCGHRPSPLPPQAAKFQLPSARVPRLFADRTRSLDQPSVDPDAQRRMLDERMLIARGSAGRVDPHELPFDPRPGRPAVSLSPRYRIPLTGPRGCVAQTFCIIGIRGSGKTATSAVMIEDMVSGGAQVVVVDLLGALHGLTRKEGSPENATDGIDITWLGGDGGEDMPPTSGTVVAHRVAGTEKDREGGSFLIDLSAMRKSDAVAFVADFLEELYELQQQPWRRTVPIHLAIDETDVFAPRERADDSQKRTLVALDDITRRGRLRGFGLTMITQRPAAMHKDVLTQAKTLVLGGLTSPHDREAVKDWVRGNATDDEWFQLQDDLANLPVGTFWVWSPLYLGRESMRRVAVRRRWTADSSATPVFVGDGGDEGEDVTEPMLAGGDEDAEDERWDDDDEGDREDGGEAELDDAAAPPSSRRDGGGAEDEAPEHEHPPPAGTLHLSLDPDDAF